MSELPATPAPAPELVRRMGYHPATDATAPRYEANRERFIDLAQHVVDTAPAGRERSLALTALQEALMWANAAIACNPTTRDVAGPVNRSGGDPMAYTQGEQWT